MDKSLEVPQRNEREFDMRRREPPSPEQQSLFPTEELIVPETLRSMKKAVAAIHATPLSAEYNQTLNGRRLFDGLILVAQLDFQARYPKNIMDRVRTERISPMFETRISDLARLSGIPGKNYERLYGELDRLFDVRLAWNIVGEDSTVQWEMKSHFLASLGYGKGEKRGMVRFSMEPAILEIILEPTNWAKLSWEVMANLKTGPSLALYQNAWRYINTNAKVTAALPVATWIELLLGKSRYVIEESNGAKRVNNYADFKRRTLLDAIRRINETPALDHMLELKEFKSGTTSSRVSKLQFRFLAKSQPSLGIPLTWPADVQRVLEAIGFPETDIKNLSQAHSYETVAEAIVLLKTAEERIQKAGKRITSRKAYFFGILNNIADGVRSDEIDHEQIESEIKQQELLREAEARQERTKAAFSQHQIEKLSSWLFSLPIEEREQLISRFERSADGAKARPYLGKGWGPSSVGAMRLLRNWIEVHDALLLDQALPEPQDRSLENWMAWKLCAD